MRLPRNLTRSSVASSAQCMSSNATTMGARRSRKRCSSIENSACRSVSTSSNASSFHCNAMSRNGPSGRGVNSASHAPVTTSVSGRVEVRNRSSSVLFPIPASPATRTTRPAPRRTCASSRASVSSAGPRSSSSFTQTPAPAFRCGTRAYCTPDVVRTIIARPHRRDGCISLQGNENDAIPKDRAACYCEMSLQLTCRRGPSHPAPRARSRRSRAGTSPSLRTSPRSTSGATCP